MRALRKVLGGTVVAIGFAVALIGGILDSVVWSDGSHVYGNTYLMFVVGLVLMAIGMWIGDWIDHYS